MRNPNRGSTLIELIMVMLLLVLIGAAISVLIFAGGGTQERIINEKNAQMDARVALSYVNMFIRQNDAAGKVTVTPNAYTGENSILIRTREDWGGYDTWIYWMDGRLYECLVDQDEQPALGLSFVVAEVDYFRVSRSDDGAINNTIGYTTGDKSEEMSSTIFLRSAE